MEDLSFGSRLVLALSLPFKVLFNGRRAARIAQADATLALPEAPSPAVEQTEAPPAAEPSMKEVEPERDLTPALQLLAILQREGRFIDFVREDMSSFGDAEIGAAARVVQDGCKRGLQGYLQLAPIRGEQEGAAVTLEPGYDARATRVTGNVTGEPPFRGSLAHHGWRAESLQLPQLAAEHDPRILAPAEVEI